jgi:hypothetical protein
MTDGRIRDRSYSRLVQRSSRTLKAYAQLDWPLSHIIIVIFGMPRSKISMASSSLLSQLSAKSDSCYDLLSQLYSDNAGGTRKPDSTALTECVKDILGLEGQGPIYIIIDALDECPDISGTPSGREEVLELVDDLVNLNLPNVHLCVASRPEIDIRKALEPLQPLEISLHDEDGQKNDIIEYIRSVVYSDRKMRNWREEDKQLVVKTLSDKADGM